MPAPKRTEPTVANRGVLDQARNIVKEIITENDAARHKAAIDYEYNSETRLKPTTTNPDA